MDVPRSKMGFVFKAASDGSLLLGPVIRVVLVPQRILCATLPELSRSEETKMVFLISSVAVV
jgi:hypothetical protein